MKLFFHLSPLSFSNCYILGEDLATPPATHRDVVLVDPGYLDEKILGFIEGNEYNLRGILITHAHQSHVSGLKTLMRIYDAEIYAMYSIPDHKTTLIHDRDVFSVGSFRFEVISIPGHSSDSVCFKIDHLLFTGDVLSAGLVGSTASAYGATTQMTALRSKLLSMPGDYTVLPGHGPPSSLDVERRFNAGIQFYEKSKHFLPVFYQPSGAAPQG
jgi:glyoxylase-like metal-dependent hydrolase (beta-lactamase superfamily II)